MDPVGRDRDERHRPGGSVTLLLDEETLDRLLLPLVALAAGSLLGGALFHMVPGALAGMDSILPVFVWLLKGFTIVLVLEQFLHWHYCHRKFSECRKPLTYLILIGDGLHNFMGGLAVAGAFVIDVRLGISTWLAAAAHEIPQELEDYGILVHGGWTRGRALAFNLASGLSFLVGALLTYLASFEIDVTLLLPFAAGNFLYIAASDLVPEVNRAGIMGGRSPSTIPPRSSPASSCCTVSGRHSEGRQA